MKDKLVKLLMTEIECKKTGNGGCSTCEYEYADDKCMQYYTELIADYLLANGVIVPPCKAGDTVYCLDTIGNPINDYVVQNVGITATQGGFGIERGFDDFGKTVFLTKEEAKRALKEREHDGW